MVHVTVSDMRLPPNFPIEGRGLITESAKVAKRRRSRYHSSSVVGLHALATFQSGRLGSNRCSGRLRDHKRGGRVCYTVGYSCFASRRRPVPARAGSREPLALFQDRPNNTHARERGPREAIESAGLETMSGAQREVWLEEARVDAILGACRLSMKSVRSGIKCYLAFAGGLLGSVRIGSSISRCSGRADPHRARLLPPRLNVLQSWSTMFRCERTFGNYLGHVRTACQLACVSTKVTRFVVVL